MIFFSTLCAAPALAASANGICSGLSEYLANPGKLALPDPARTPNPLEQQLIKKSDIELLSRTDYDMGASVVDTDNDGKNEIFVWNVDGTGRFATIEIFEMTSEKNGHIDHLVSKGSISSGVLVTPHFIRFKGVNYLVSTDTGDQEGLRVSQIEKLENGEYQLRTLCNMTTVVTPDAQCRHPACKELQHQMANKSSNARFIDVEWPHKYFAPAGLATYFEEADGDFDNTGQSSTIWRIGREDYAFENIYWDFLGLGEEKPPVDQKLHAEAEKGSGRRVLPGHQHERLSNVLNQQSATLSSQLQQTITLPKQGEFFLFQANQGRTYWAWDFGGPPYGSEIHIMYTNAKRSDYIGVVRLARSSFLERCTSDCVTLLSR